jgi:hypothetical protein
MGDYSHRKRKIRSKKRVHKRVVKGNGTRRGGSKAAPRKLVQMRTRFVVARARRGDFSG